MPQYAMVKIDEVPVPCLILNEYLSGCGYNCALLFDNKYKTCYGIPADDVEFCLQEEAFTWEPQSDETLVGLLERLEGVYENWKISGNVENLKNVAKELIKEAYNIDKEE